MNKKQKKKAYATAGAVVLALGVLHLADKASASETTPTLPPAVACPGILPPMATPPDGVCPTTPATARPVPTTIYPCPDDVQWNEPIGGPGWCAGPRRTPPSSEVSTTVVIAPAKGCRNEHYQDGNSEVICDTNGALPVDVPQVAVDTPASIQEDDPRWDCKTMGNQRCGDEASSSCTRTASGHRCGPPAATSAPKQALPATGNGEVLFAFGGVGAAMLVAGTTLAVAYPRRKKTIVVDIELGQGQVQSLDSARVEG